MKEMFTNLAYGVGTVCAIAATMAGLVFFMEAVEMTKDSIRLAIATPLFILFCYHFGALTRSVLSKND